MYLLDTEVIAQGDVILTAQSRFTSAAVRKATKSDFSHVILYVGGGSYIHADGSGVHSANTQRLLFASQGIARCYRPTGCTAEQIDNVCRFARSRVGMEYSVPEAVKSKFRRAGAHADSSNRQFCSRLVAQAFEFGGINLVINPNYCYPEDIAQSEQLLEISGCIREATEAEVAFAQSENPIEKQSEVTNEIFRKVRSLTDKDIQTFEQLTQLVISYPNYDSAVSTIVMESGYLTFWKIDVLRNPWRYSKEAFERVPVPHDEKLRVAEQELAVARAQLNQYGQMADFFSRHWSKYRLHYLALELQLYTKLVELCRDRIVVAEGYLSSEHH